MLPSLSTSRRIRLTAFTSFYVAQGLPMGLITVALPAWLGANDVDPAVVATFIATAMLPWAFKLLAGPLMDRFRFPSLGNRRPWVMFAQSGLLLALASLAAVDPGISDIAAMTLCCVAVSSFAAFQDVAVDGMAIDVLPESERGRANALMAFGQVAGIAVSGSACGWTLANLGLAFTAVMLAVFIAIILAIVVAFRERDGERLLPWTEGSSHHPEAAHTVSWWSIVSNLFRVLILPGSLLLIVVTLFWRIGHGMYIAVLPTLLTQELGWDGVQASSWISISQFVGAMLGVAIGPLIDRHGARLFLSWGLVFAAAAFTAMWLVTPWWDLRMTWIIGLFVTKFAIQVLFVAFIALHMTICWSRVAATQFAIYMAWANLAYSMGAQVYAELTPYLELGQETLVMASFCLLGFIVLAFVRLERHRERLEKLKPTGVVEDPLVDIPARH